MTTEHLFLSIEMLINTISLIIMIPCLLTLQQTKSMHGNCKVILVTSASVQLAILVVQTLLFIHNFTINNLSQNEEAQRPYEMAQNSLFIMSSCLSLVLVIERSFAIRHAAEYERRSYHPLPLFLSFGLCLMMSLMKALAVYYQILNIETIFILYTIEGFTLGISGFIIVYARRKIHSIPYDGDRVKEVLDFSVAILPSVILSVIMHTISLVPSLLLINDLMSYTMACLIYFSVHSLNCILTKLTLIACHKGMRNRLLAIVLPSRLSGRITPEPSPVSDKAEDTRIYFSMIQSSWNE